MLTSMNTGLLLKYVKDKEIVVATETVPMQIPKTKLLSKLLVKILYRTFWCWNVTEISM